LAVPGEGGARTVSGKKLIDGSIRGERTDGEFAQKIFIILATDPPAKTKNLGEKSGGKSGRRKRNRGQF